MAKGIDEMHRRFGVLPGKRCEDCKNLLKGDYRGVTYRKCTVYGASHSSATDWRKRYEACGMYDKDWSSAEIIRTMRRDAPKEPEQPLDGQLTFGEVIDD